MLHYAPVWIDALTGSREGWRAGSYYSCRCRARLQRGFNPAPAPPPPLTKVLPCDVRYIHHTRRAPRSACGSNRGRSKTCVDAFCTHVSVRVRVRRGRGDGTWHVRAEPTLSLMTRYQASKACACACRGACAGSPPRHATRDTLTPRGRGFEAYSPSGAASVRRWARRRRSRSRSLSIARHGAWI
ncbi:hypothetical protein BC628DRAFT_666304 [Trametes gibbosa]|nr:hypothetical protein BC628DRAFT_666304 [Trametes gibbosa]